MFAKLDKTYLRKLLLLLLLLTHSICYHLMLLLLLLLLLLLNVHLQHLFSSLQLQFLFLLQSHVRAYSVVGVSIWGGRWKQWCCWTTYELNMHWRQRTFNVDRRQKLNNYSSKYKLGFPLSSEIETLIKKPFPPLHASSNI